jgi:hypothetical protein
LVYGCDCDFVPKLAKGSRQHLSAFLLGFGIRFNALLDKSRTLVQDLPNHTAEPMSDGPEGGLIAQPGEQTPEHELKMTTSLLDSSVCRLVQHPVQIFIVLGGATAVVLFGAFVFSGTGPHPKKSIPPLREMYWLPPHFCEDLLHRDKFETHECRGGAAKETTGRHLVLSAPIVVHACFTAAMISCWRAFTNGAEYRLVQRKERP